ncbi:MAG: hypothetical protein ACE5HX_05895 [bacterium]
MQDEVQTIYGYVDLTNDARKWIKYQIARGDKNTQHFGFGWSVIPAHWREDPLKGILVKGYPDAEESIRYVFDNPENRDRAGNIKRDPLPIYSKRDLEWFREENERMKNSHGFWFYRLFKARKSYIQAYNPEDDFSENIGNKETIASESPIDELVTVPAELPTQAKEKLVEKKSKKRGRPKKIK